MLRTIIFVLVLLVIISILLLIHFYLYRRIVSSFALSRTGWLLTAFFLLALCFPLAMFLSRTVDGPLIRPFYGLAAAWFGFVFLGLGVFGMLHLAELLFRLASHPLPPRVWGWASLWVTVLIGVYGIINAAVIRTTEATIGLKNFKEPKVTIALLTDIHVGAVYGPKYLQKIVDRTNALNPDLVAIAGDLFDGSAKPGYKLVQPLEKLQAPAFFVTGNHEIYEGIDITTALVAKTGVRVLRNEAAECSGLQIFGVDSPRGNSKNNPALLELTAKLNRDKQKPSVLLYHIPLEIEDAQRSGIDLQLSGHTHNGQIFPFSLFIPLAYKFYSGYGQDGEFQIYVSPGVGTWGPPMRIGSRSEIVLITLVPQ
ncbi:metallophosphoesterase [candidate division TA06 bacterium]|uniref:Metallophosphoesterase n=1 Tax=candidate division TA06 bacterium TaxID=2250710 RepID=A0A933MJ42_UNCT6|nr:metallophosphoesterase [candidate division TA06 bacterium]